MKTLTDFSIDFKEFLGQVGANFSIALPQSGYSLFVREFTIEKVIDGTVYTMIFREKES